MRQESLEPAIFSAFATISSDAREDDGDEDAGGPGGDDEDAGGKDEDAEYDDEDAGAVLVLLADGLAVVAVPTFALTFE